MFVFTKYGALGASSRVRFLTYLELELLPKDNVQISELFNDEYITNLYSNKKSLPLIVKSYLKRFFTLIGVLFNRTIKIVWIEKELFPYIPVPFECLLTLFGKKVVYDFDDAVFHNYNRGALRSLFRLKFQRLMKSSSLVFAGNQYLYDHVVDMGAKNVKLIPTVIDLSAYNQGYHSSLNEINDETNISIGWIGSPSTQKYLSIVDDAIYQLQTELDISISLKLIGVNQDLVLKSNFEVISWSKETEISNILSFDIGIMPLFDSPFEKGKCGYKIIQYFACRKPVLASPIGVNNTIIENGINGFLCNTHDDWYRNLKKLILDNDECKKLGNYGFKLVEGDYTYQKQSLNIMEALKAL